MSSVAEAATEFLSHKRIAVAGVSREPQGHGSNVVFRRLRDRGYDVVPVNPNADEVEDVPCYHDLRSIPGGVEGVVIATPPDAAESVARECRELGITRVWMHRLYGEGSVSEVAVGYCRANGISAIVGGCPLMFGPTADMGHRCMRWAVGFTGNRPTTVP